MAEPRRLFLLVNALDEFTFGPLVREVLPGVRVTVGEDFPAHPADYHLVVLWSIRRLVPQAASCPNAMVFHSSDLPRGKGWAPVYHAIAGGLDRYTITGFIPAPEVDAGRVVVKASFRLRPDHTAENVRVFDRRIILMLAGQVMDRYPEAPPRGVEQTGEETYHPRRRPQDNEVSLDARLGDLVPHLRACEPSHPAFFDYQGVRYDIRVTPAVAPPFPDDLQVTFFE